MPKALPFAGRPIARPAWLLFACACIAAAIVSSALYAQMALFYPESYGGVASASLGAKLERTTDRGRIDVIVRDLKPGTPLAAVVREGDRLRLDIPWNDFRTVGTGETFGFTRVAPGPRQHLAITVPDFTGSSKSVANVRFLITLFDLSLGLLLFWRCFGDTGAEALGIAFIAATITSNFPAPPLWSMLWITLAYAGVAAVPFLMLAFALSFFGRHTRPLGSGERHAYVLLCGALVISFLIAFYSNFTAFTSPLIHGNVFALMIEITLAYGGTVYVLAGGYRRADGDLRRRYLLLLIALLLTFALSLVQTFSFLVLKRAKMDPDNPLYDVNVVLSLLGPLLFSYAVLRHRVVDLGFVVNRTLVYGAVSLILLTAFGLTEWGVDKWLKPEGHQVSAIIDALVALGIFLTFHRVRDFVEHHLEALFFRSWHDNERTLRRFVFEASFITGPEALLAAFARELSRFTGGADYALYLGEGDAGYRAEVRAGRMPDSIDIDHPAPVALRAHRSGVEIGDGNSAGSAVIALPMFQRASLIGLVLLGPKARGEHYRPDEQELLAQAAHQIGLDLHALRVEQLEKRTSELVEQVQLLKAENRSLLDASAAA